MTIIAARRYHKGRADSVPVAIDGAVRAPIDEWREFVALRASYDAAIANFAGKPPLNDFTREALDAYVRYGFAKGSDGAVHLKCTPETEAGTFATGGRHTTWEHLPTIDTEVLVIAGVLQPMQPSMIAGPVAEQLPNGRHVQRDDLDHFGPMTHPLEIAALISAELSR